MDSRENLQSSIRKILSTQLTEAGLAEFVQDRALLDYLSGKLTDEAIRSQPALYNALVRGITLPVSQEALREAETMAMRQAKTLVTGEARTQLKAIGEVIRDGLQHGDNPRLVARRLEMIDSLDSVRAKQLAKYIRDLEKMGLSPEEIKKRASRMKNKLLRDRRETIARTEARYAQEEASAVEARAAGKQYKSWMTMGDDRVSHLCISNENAGWIDIDKPFPSGHDQPPGHPRCRCTLSYRAAAPDAAAQDRLDNRIKQRDIRRKLGIKY